jgi:hypothetical protein
MGFAPFASLIQNTAPDATGSTSEGRCFARGTRVDHIHLIKVSSCQLTSQPKLSQLRGQAQPV